MGKIGYSAPDGDDGNKIEWKSGAAAVSIGDTTNDEVSKRFTRQITGLAAGTEDSDAVNVAQLKKVAAAGTVHYVSVNATGAQVGNYNNDGASGVGTIAIGRNAEAKGANSVSVGLDVGKGTTGIFNFAFGSEAGQNLTGEENISIGREANNNNTATQNVAIGLRALMNSKNTVGGENKVAGQGIGVGSNAMGSSALQESDGGQNNAMGTRAGFRAKGYGNVFIGTLAGDHAGETAILTNSILMGTHTGAAAGGDKNVIIGNFVNEKVVASNVVAVGSDSKVKQQFGIGLGHGLSVNATDGVALGAYTKVLDDVTNGVALGHSSVADRKAFTISTKAPFSEEDLNGKTLGAVSVGSNGKLRQIRRRYRR